MSQLWTPAPGMAIKHMLIENKAVVVRLEHPAQKDGTGALWVIREEQGEVFAYETNLQTYWAPVVDEAPKKK